MTRIHALVITLAVAFAVVAGAFAAFRTTRLGEGAAAGVSPVALAGQSRALDKSEAALKRSLRSRPPKLPKVPKVHKPKLPSGTAPPVVHVVHVTQPPAPAATVAATTTTAVAGRTQTTTPRLVTTAPTTTTKSSPHQAEHEGTNGGPDD